MELAEFDKSVAESLKRVRELLARKGKEYARGDRLSAFKQAGALMRCSPERACLGMLAKHLVSIADLVNDLDAGTETPQPIWHEKLGDAVAYLIVLEALIVERHA